MRVILSFRPQHFLPPEMYPIFEAYFKEEKSRAQLEAELALDRDVFNQIMTTFFERALAHKDDTAHLEIHP